ncbi:MAG TPA: 2TM domain-containing protein [Fimbriimonas sp.]|nr:2TM domain-containing protein [Fimbriimonas sp.]
MSQKFYEEEEADAILRLAAQRTGAGGMTREKLLSTAAELGITPEAVEQAERDIRRQSQEGGLRKEFERGIRSEFYADLTSYVLVNGFLCAINYLTAHSINWAIWPILGWGLGLAFHVKEAFFKGSQEHEAEFQKWLAKRKSRELAESDAAADLAGEWLLAHPDDADGAAQYVKEKLAIKKRDARTTVELVIRKSRSEL